MKDLAMAPFCYHFLGDDKMIDSLAADSQIENTCY